jgi:predicted site-specific integrase-resolvase
MAQRLRIKRRTLDEWSLSGLIPRVKMNNKLVRYDPAAVVRALEAAQSAGVKE